MDIELPKEAQARAVLSIQRYFDVHMEDKIGNIAAGGLLGFFMQEIAPLVYNQAVADVQERLQMRVSEVDIELHAEEFQYWPKYDKASKK
jgi:uncharacterized protein (DUF2164 family)